MGFGGIENPTCRPGGEGGWVGERGGGLQLPPHTSPPHFLGRLPLHYGGQLHMWGQFYMGGTGGSIQVAPANNI